MYILSNVKVFVESKKLWILIWVSLSVACKQSWVPSFSSWILALPKIGDFLKSVRTDILEQFQDFKITLAMDKSVSSKLRIVDVPRGYIKDTQQVSDF